MNLWDAMLKAPTEGQFFVAASVFLDTIKIGDVNSTTMLMPSTHPRPHLRLALFRSLCHPLPTGEVSYRRDKIWQFSLFADGELTGEIARFAELSLGVYSLPQVEVLPGLKEIQSTLANERQSFEKMLSLVVV